MTTVIKDFGKSNKEFIEQNPELLCNIVYNHYVTTLSTDNLDAFLEWIAESQSNNIKFAQLHKNDTQLFIVFKDHSVFSLKATDEGLEDVQLGMYTPPKQLLN